VAGVAVAGVGPATLVLMIVGLFHSTKPDAALTHQASASALKSGNQRLRGRRSMVFINEAPC
jgi:hypothetical protein